MSGRNLISITVLLMVAVMMVMFIPGCGKGEETSTVPGQGITERKTPEIQAEGEWKSLISGSNLEGWLMEKPGSWKVEDGVMSLVGGGYIWTKERYGNFVLDCEFKIGPGGNSGIFFRTGDLEDPVQTGIEMQVLDSPGEMTPGKHDCGAIYDLLEPRSFAAKPQGDWHHVTITCKDNLINVFMNGIHIINMDLDKWTTPSKNPDGTSNKFNRALKDFPREGHIGFQDHGDPVWYRNVRIKEL